MKLEDNILEFTDRELEMLQAVVDTADPYEAADNCRVNVGTDESPWYESQTKEMEEFLLKFSKIISEHRQ